MLNATKKVTTSSLVIAALVYLLPACCLAAPTRSSLPAGLFGAYDNPQFFQTGVDSTTGLPFGPHMDKFYDQTLSESKEYTVVYDIDDPIVMYSLRGARFTSIVQDLPNRKLYVSFTPYVDFGSEDSAIYVVLFTSALFESTTPGEGSGLKASMQNAFFDSKFVRVTRIPDLQTKGDLYYEGFPAAVFSFTPLTDETQAKTYSIRTFLPNTLFSQLNSGKAFKSSDILVKRTSTTGEIANLFDAAQVGVDGVLFNFTHEFRNETSPLIVDMSIAPKTGLTASSKVAEKNSTVYLHGFIKNCTTSFQTRLQKNTKSNSDTGFKNIKRISATGCEFTFAEQIKKTTVYRFLYKKRYYSAKVTVK